MRCQVTSNKTHGILISKEISYKTYKEICSGEPKKVNLGYADYWAGFKVENNSLLHIPRVPEDNIHGRYAVMPLDSIDDLSWQLKCLRGPSPHLVIVSNPCAWCL